LARGGTFYAGFDPLRALYILLFHRNADIVLVGFESGLAFIVLLARLFRFRPKLVMHEVSARGWPKRDRILDYVIPRIDQILVLTSHQKTEIEARYRLKNPARIIGFAVDDNFYHPRKQPPGGYILAVGDDPGRDYASLIEACRDLPHTLILRTNQPPAAVPGATILGRQTYEELRDLYAGASLVVVPLQAVDHPSGITAVFEAMAMGCTLIASAIGTTRQVLVDRHNAILVPVGDVAALRHAILELMADPELRARLGTNARADLDRHYSYDAYIAGFAAALRTVAEAPPLPCCTAAA
jgi:glycosyltransferase involved in cell wall biosynthesis